MDVNFIESDSYFPKEQVPFQGEMRNEKEPYWYNESGSTGVGPGPSHDSGAGARNDSGAGAQDDSGGTGHDSGGTDHDSGAGAQNDSSGTGAGAGAQNETSYESTNSECENEENLPDEENVIQSPLDTPQGPTPERHPEISNTNSESTSDYQLPFRHNRGKPAPRYEPEYKPKKTAKYAISNYMSISKLSGKLKAFAATISDEKIPEKVEEALKNPKWREAMDVEMEALEKNRTWKLVGLPEGKKTVGCKWVFSIKYDADGKVERYKARLVAKGYTQTYGIDFQETFSPVAKFSTVRVLISLAANLDWPLHQFDVKNAFLHGNLEEEIYMSLPPGFDYSDSGHVVCKLEKALYGLKQSPRAWFGRFSGAMRKYGYTQSDSDHTLFIKRNQEKLTLLIIYVDDMIITGNDEEEIKKLQEKLSQEFEMKNLGGLKYFLGVEVARSKQGIFLSQRKYILDLLAEVGMLDCKPIGTPIEQNYKPSGNNEGVSEDKEAYQRLVGKLIYLSHTRPDIAYATSVASQFMHSPTKDNMELVIRIIRYLKGSLGRGVMFRKNENLDIIGYTDADWARCRIDRRSTSGYFTLVGGNLVSWRSKKQSVVSLSSAEAEFRGMTKGICEILWIRKLLKELGYPPTKEVMLYCDNKAAIDIAQNPVQHDRTKHIEIDRHFIKENLESKIIKFPHVRSEEQLADMLTKGVSSKMFYSSLDKLGVCDIYTPLEGECYKEHHRRSYCA